MLTPGGGGDPARIDELTGMVLDGQNISDLLDLAWGSPSLRWTVRPTPASR